MSDCSVKIEALIVSGQTKKARKLLKALNYANFDRSEKVILADLAYRCGLPRITLRLLKDFIYQKNNLIAQPSIAEVSTYSAALTKLGAQSEAIRLLGESAQEDPNSTFQLAMAFISQWNYLDAEKQLKIYLDFEDINDFQRLLGKVNLAAAYVTQWQPNLALPILEELLPDLTLKNLNLLLGNVLELFAQAHMQLGSYKLSRQYLNKSLSILEDHKGNYFYYAKKWEVVLNFYEGGVIDRNIRKMENLRDYALANNIWEIVREIDFYRGYFLQNEILVSKAYVGTPYPAYRNKIKNVIGDKFSPPNHFFWKWEKRDKESLDYFDIQMGKDIGGRGQIRGGQLGHQLIRQLASDFYKPFTLIGLYSQLFPEFHYNLNSSPLQFHQLLNRTRNWLKKNNIPLSIENSSNFYFLVGHGNYAIKVYSESEKKSSYDLDLLSLKNHFKDKRFSARDAQEFLNVSRTQVTYILKGRSAEGLVKSGKGRSTKYNFEEKKAA